MSEIEVSQLNKNLLQFVTNSFQRMTYIEFADRYFDEDSNGITTTQTDTSSRYTQPTRCLAPSAH